MRIKVSVEPTSEPVTLDEVRAHVRPAEDEGVYLDGLITAAREYCETQTDRSLAPKTYQLGLDAFPSSGVLELPRPPLVSVASIEYTDADGVTQTLSASDYEVATLGEPGRVLLGYGKAWPTIRDEGVADPVVVTYVAGISVAPKTIKQAILLLVGHWYENREAVITGTISKEVEFSLRALLNANAWGGIQ